MAKNKTSVLPILVVAIIGFLAYKANPDYWKQGKIFEDFEKYMQNRQEQQEELTDVPIQQEAVKKQEEPEIDPDASFGGSVDGSKTIPINVNKAVHRNDPTYYVLRTSYKTIYFVYEKGSQKEQLYNELRNTIKESDFKQYWAVSGMSYEKGKMKEECTASVPLNFLCEQCAKGVCLLNPRKKEFLVVPLSKSAIMSRVKSLTEREGWIEQEEE